MDLLVLMVVAAAAIGGVGLGWYLGVRQSAAAKSEIERIRREWEASREEGEAWRLKFSDAIVNLAAEKQKVESLGSADAELRAERERAAGLAARIAAFERGEAERQRAHDQQLSQLREL